METSVKIKENIPLPDSTTTFLSPQDFDSSSQEAAEAVATLQVTTDTHEMDQFNDLFNVTSCSEPFTLIDSFGNPLAATTNTNLDEPNPPKMTSLKPISPPAEAVYSLLQSTSSNPTLGTAVLTNSSSEVMVTSTTLDHQPTAPLMEVTNSRGQKNVVVSSMINNDLYTLTLTDGSVVQLKVQNDNTDGPHNQPQIVHQEVQDHAQNDEAAGASAAAVVSGMTDLDNVSQTWLPSHHHHHHDVHIGSNHADGIRSSSVSPASFAEEVTLSYAGSASPTSANHQNNSDTTTIKFEISPTSPTEVLTSHPASPCMIPTDSMASPCVSPTEVFRPSYNKYNNNKRSSKRLKNSTTTNSSSKKIQPHSRSFSYSSDDSHNYSALNSDTDDIDNEDNQESLLSLFSSMEKVTIEKLKAKLSALPDGQTDLGALLVAAKIDLTVEDIVGPPLTTVKKIMEAKSLSDWQQTLCLKIRRRKKNTAAVRSSRRKRNQYVVDLREHVIDLKKRKQDAYTQHQLLIQLTSLWQRLCSEVETEIQDGVRHQLGFAPNNLPIYDDMEVSLEPISHLNHRLLTTLGQQQQQSTVDQQSSILNNKKSTSSVKNNNNNNNNNQPEKTMITDEMMDNLLYHTDLQFESTHDRGAMEL